jgi:hypothetical protein
MRLLAVAASLLALAPAAAGAAVDVDTYHNDTFRSGWNQNETALTPATVGSRSFKKLFTAHLNGLIYGQPLIAAGEAIPGEGTHDLVIAATNSDYIYAFNADGAGLIWKHSFADKAEGVNPVPLSFVAGCNATGSEDGVLSTPVIDRTADRIYVVAATLEGVKPHQHIHHRLHALQLSTGQDAMTPVDIAGSFAGPQGTITFDGDVQFQRPALLEANGNVYVAFGSQCDYYANQYHGWVFAYATSNFAQTAVINVTPSTDSNGNYYGGIWMAGDGPGADASGNVYFAVGNGTFDGVNNFGESLLRLPPNLSLTGSSFFAPYTAYQDNAYDADFGSGGIALLPDQPGSVPHQIVGQGKDGILTLLNRDNLGGYVPGGPDNALAEIGLGGVWAAPATWEDGNGVTHVLTTGGPLYDVVVGTNSLTVADYTSVYFPSPNGNGSTPSVSSNGSADAIAWIVQRPGDISSQQMYLYAFPATNLGKQLIGIPLGYWSTAALNPYPVVTIANGKVYVPVTDAIEVFGLK